MTDRQFLDVPGGRLAYSVTGPAVVRSWSRCTGWARTGTRSGCWPRPWSRAGHRVACLDLRGHGESSTGWAAYDAEHVAGDILALIRELGGPAVIVGSSIASAAATFAAADSPDDVRGIVLIGGQIRRRPLSRFQRIALAAVLRSADPLGRLLPQPLSRRKPADFKADTGRLLRQLREPGRMEAVGRVLDPTTVPWGQRAAAVTCSRARPHGVEDPDFPDPADEAQATVAAFTSSPSVALRMVEGSGHYPFLDAPQVTTEAVTGFLAGAVRA